MLENIVVGGNNKKVETKVREINNSSFKSLFTKLYMRRASSYRQQKLYEKAIHDYEFLLKLLPDDKGNFSFILIPFFFFFFFFLFFFFFFSKFLLSFILLSIKIKVLY